MILSCSYLYFLSFRAYLSIPLLTSRQNKCRHIQNIKSKKDGKHPFMENRCSVHINDNDASNTHFENSLLKDLPFVSVIVPARNEEKYIERCLLSLLSQCYPHFEIIAIDDNSSDSTLKIMKDIKNKAIKKRNKALPTSKLKIISLKDKPKNWTGKTWASQQGYLQSRGDVLLFTDADTHYVSRYVIMQSVLYMQKQDLDVLTGIFYPEKLSNIWSKVTVPLWDSVSILFGVGSADVNDPKSKTAYVMGSFFLIKRNVFTNIGTFESVCQEIQEDKAIGILIKKGGYKIKLIRLDEMVFTLWADDLRTLWHGIGRTLAPLVLKNRLKVVLNLFAISFATALPFVFFPVTLWVSFGKLLSVPMFAIPSNPYFYLMLLNLISFAMTFVLYSLKCKRYRVKPLYSFGIVFASVFAVSACLYTIVPLLTFGKTKPIAWQGRQYVYNRERGGFSL